MDKKIVTWIEDASDGSGDGILTIPPEILKEIGWYEGLMIEFDTSEENVIIMRPKNPDDVANKQHK